MVYFTGDIHGSPWKIKKFCTKMQLNESDVIVILGDVGINYYEDYRDDEIKKILNDLKPIIFCIHGNHEQRPECISTYEETVWNNGVVYKQQLYPNLLFAKDGEIFNINGLKYFIIGGAYSVDKYYRLQRGYNWFENEQPSQIVKQRIEQRLNQHKIDVFLTHTCPYKYEPREMFISGVDQSQVDSSTEIWLDTIEEQYDYSAWFCGHWHTDKRVKKMHFLFNSFESDELIKKEIGNNNNNYE